jgi:prepilin-type N-terminal cleavage/methylation domain-containing protein
VRAICGERGVTLTELMAVAAILSVVLVAFIPVLSLGSQTWGRFDKHSEMLQNARRAVDKIVRDMRAVRSFRLVTSSLVRFTMAVGDGTGATPTVEYQLNGATNNFDTRTSADFDYRRRLTVTAGTSALPLGYSVSVVVNHASLVAAGKSLASGDDVRIRYWTGTQWVELDRFKDPTTAWNTATTQIWFKLQAAIAANGSNNNYYLYYGDLSAPPPPANGDYVFLDYEDGTTLANWTRQDACNGTNTASADGFVFQATSTACLREFSKPVTNGDVEIFWGFQSNGPAGTNTNRHQPGMGARRSATGAGYQVVPGDGTNDRLSIYRLTSWTANNTLVDHTGTGNTLTPGTAYYGRFYLVGTTLQAKYWAAGTAEPAWMLTATDSTYASGVNYSQVDGNGATAAAPQDHRHRYIIVRQRVATDPTITQAVEESGARADAFQPLGGPFRTMAVTCYDATDASINCSSVASVKSVQVALTTMDSTGEVADIVVTSRAYRQTP